MNITNTIVALSIAISLIIAAPFVTLWSMNTLFGLGISYTFKSWLAMCWLSLTTFGSVNLAINNLKK